MQYLIIYLAQALLCLAIAAALGAAIVFAFMWQSIKNNPRQFKNFFDNE